MTGALHDMQMVPCGLSSYLSLFIGKKKAILKKMDKYISVKIICTMKAIVVGAFYLFIFFSLVFLI